MADSIPVRLFCSSTNVCAFRSTFTTAGRQQLTTIRKSQVDPETIKACMQATPTSYAAESGSSGLGQSSSGDLRDVQPAGISMFTGSQNVMMIDSSINTVRGDQILDDITSVINGRPEKAPEDVIRSDPKEHHINESKRNTRRHGNIRSSNGVPPAPHSSRLRPVPSTVPARERQQIFSMSAQSSNSPLKQSSSAPRGDNYNVDRTTYINSPTTKIKVKDVGRRRFNPRSKPEAIQAMNQALQSETLQSDAQGHSGIYYIDSATYEMEESHGAVDYQGDMADLSGMTPEVIAAIFGNPTQTVGNRDPSTLANQGESYPRQANIPGGNVTHVTAQQQYTTHTGEDIRPSSGHGPAHQNVPGQQQRIHISTGHGAPDTDHNSGSYAHVASQGTPGSSVHAQKPPLDRCLSGAEKLARCSGTPPPSPHRKSHK